MRKREADAIKRILLRFADGNYGAIDRRNVSHEWVRILESIRSNIERSETEVKRLKIKNSTDAAGVAHDLKTPIAVIMGAAECISDGMDDKDYLAVIKEKAEQMSETVSNLTDAARAVADGEGDFKETLNARAFFTAEFERQRVFAESRGLVLKTGRVPKDARIVVDRKKMSRVVQNIVTNAVKYSPKGSKISVKFSVRNGKIAVSVKDGGSGISEENLPYVFDKFFMEDKARTGGGSGLGLYVAKEIVVEHGGDITVKSKKGKGSTFTVILPLKASEAKTATERFDESPFVLKFCVVFFFGMFFGFIYRMIRFGERHYAKTLAGAWIAMFMMPFTYIFDILSVIFYGRITFLAD